MSISCLDLDGTLTADPAFYKAVASGLMKAGDEVHILSANPEAESVLRELEMLKGRDYTRCAVVPLKGVARFKVAYMQHVGATHLIDNQGKNCRRAVAAGFTALHHLSPKGPS